MMLPTVKGDVLVRVLPRYGSDVEGAIRGGYIHLR